MNEVLLATSAIVDVGLVWLAFSRKRSWVYTTIVVNLILISVLGPKVIEVWGFATNAGNIYYASVFFAVYLLLEHGSRAHVFRALSIGVVSIGAFAVLLQLGLGTQSIPETAHIGEALQAAFGNVPRFAIASLVGFIVAQCINVALYLSSEEEPGKMHWWLRIAAVMMVAQLVDSIIFFTIAFWGEMPSYILLESMLVGYGMKVAIGLLTIPLIWQSGRQRIGTPDTQNVGSAFI